MRCNNNEIYCVSDYESKLGVNDTGVVGIIEIFY